MSQSNLELADRLGTSHQQLEEVIEGYEARH
jgi:hypothetical protein